MPRKVTSRKTVSTQLTLFPDTPSRSAQGVATPQRGEGKALYRAILRLRKAGSRVYRSGEYHKVDGRLLSRSQVMRISAHVQTSAH